MTQNWKNVWIEMNTSGLIHDERARFHLNHLGNTYSEENNGTEKVEFIVHVELTACFNGRSSGDSVTADANVTLDERLLSLLKQLQQAGRKIVFFSPEDDSSGLEEIMEVAGAEGWEFSHFKNLMSDLQQRVDGTKRQAELLICDKHLSDMNGYDSSIAQRAHLSHFGL